MSDVKQELVVTKPRRRWLRRILLVAVPIIAAVVGVDLYLRGGRYISTDNAYVAAQKVLVTPEISGTVDAITVTEGQHIKAGDVLFSFDRKPYELALEQAKAALASAANTFAGLKTQLAGFDSQIELAKEVVALRQSELDRKTKLLASRVAAASDVDSDRVNLQAAKSALVALEQSQRDVLSQLGGSLETPIESFAPWQSAKAAVDQAQWNLDQTIVRAAFDGIATQVSNIQMGRYLAAGTPVFAIVSDRDLWVDANPKETDITYLVAGQDVTVTVDAFSSTPLKGRVESISPGTGSQFSLIPAQNAAGNWVKVVQRVPVRVSFDAGQDTSKLRAGMSATVAIDTHRTRSLAGLLGLEAVAQIPEE